VKSTRRRLTGQRCYGSETKETGAPTACRAKARGLSVFARCRAGSSLLNGDTANAHAFAAQHRHVKWIVSEEAGVVRGAPYPRCAPPMDAKCGRLKAAPQPAGMQVYEFSRRLTPTRGNATFHACYEELRTRAARFVSYFKGRRPRRARIIRHDEPMEEAPGMKCFERRAEYAVLRTHTDPEVHRTQLVVPSSGSTCFV
jgi:hypothetical protein